MVKEKAKKLNWLKSRSHGGLFVKNWTILNFDWVWIEIGSNQLFGMDSVYEPGK